MNSSDELKGAYQHYKGNRYELLGVGLHTETEEKMVVYKGLYAPYQIWIRPYDMFFEMVVIDGVETPRFKKLENA